MDLMEFADYLDLPHRAELGLSTGGGATHTHVLRSGFCAQVFPTCTCELAPLGDVTENTAIGPQRRPPNVNRT